MNSYIMNKNWLVWWFRFETSHMSSESHRAARKIGVVNKTSGNSANICCTTGYSYLMTVGWFMLEGPLLLLTLGAFCLCLLTKLIWGYAIFESECECPSVYVIYYGRIVALGVLCVLANAFTTSFVFSVTVRAPCVCLWKGQRSECSVTVLLSLVSQPDEFSQTVSLGVSNDLLWQWFSKSEKSI